MRNSIVPPEEWKWFGNVGHFICGHMCRFHLCTLVGEYLVSTVGEFWPERNVREIHAKINDIAWLSTHRDLRGDAFDHAYMRRFGYEEVGYQRKYETMVFNAGEPCSAEGCGCGLPALKDGMELDFLPANDAKTATENHMQLCKKYGMHEY
jgi:hypothetical protein